jgi:16S rRNA (cytosine967-C5)-methyltransferase
MTPAGSRELALRVILRVTEHGGYSNIALPAALRRSRLDRQDRDLTTELTYGTLRRMRTLDWAIEAAAERAVSEMTPRARALLRLGAYQLLWTRIPAHAAVGETVELAGARERGFVNAVLRRLAASPPGVPSGSDDETVAVRTGLSEWAVRELCTLVGAEAEDAASGLAERSPLCLRANACRTPVEALEAALHEAGFAPRRGVIHSDTLLVDGAVPEELPGFGEGWFAVQDEASAFAAASVQAEPGSHVLDACAAPGGKAGQLACRVAPGGRLVAADASRTRASLIVRQLDRLGLPGLVLVQDARRPALGGEFDAVLVDAPCSGIGSARRRPELLWRPRRADVSRLARLQVEIAGAVVDLLRPGGRLVYSVCTFPRAETDAVCDALARRRPDLEPDVVRGPDGEAPRVRLWPHRHGTDAMFVAAFRRRKLP